MHYETIQCKMYSVGQADDTSLPLSCGRLDVGPVLLGPTQTNDYEERAGVGSGQEDPSGQVFLVKDRSVINKLDLLVTAARDKFAHSFPMEDSNLSSSASSQPDGGNLMHKASSSHRKNLSRLPFPNMVGPKCLRLMEVVNSVGASCRRRKISREARSKSGSVNDDQLGNIDETEEATEVQQQPPTNSGLNFILGENSVEDVEGFLANQKDPNVKKSEAAQLLEIQSELGINFVESKEQSEARLVEMEVRDGEKLESCVETVVPQ
jgi:hypothetical protein